MPGRRSLLVGPVLVMLALSAMSAIASDRALTSPQPGHPRLEWLREVGGRGADSANAVAIGTDGSLFVAAADQRDPRRFPDGQAPTVGRLLKLTPNGAVVWSRAFTNVELADVTVDRAGAIYATGSRRWQHGARRGTDLLMLRLDSAGRRTWSFVHRATESAVGTGIATDGSGSVYVVGTEHVDTPREGTDAHEASVVIKLDRNGQLQTTARIQDSRYRYYGRGVDVHGSDVYVAGSRGPAQIYEYDFWNKDRAALVARFDSRLDRQWTTVADRALVGRFAISGSDVTALGDGAVLVGSAGVTTDDDPWRHSHAQVLALRVNQSGHVVWLRLHGGPGYDAAGGIAIVQSGGFIVVGTRWPGHGPYGTVGVWTLTEDGDRIWSKAFGRPVEIARGRDVATGDGYAVVVGTVKNYGDHDGHDIAVARFALR